MDMTTQIHSDKAPPGPSRLSNEELELLEKLLAKMAGDFDGDVTPAFRVGEFAVSFV
jgi:hypothetical protein